MKLLRSLVFGHASAEANRDVPPSSSPLYEPRHLGVALEAKQWPRETEETTGQSSGPVFAYLSEMPKGVLRGDKRRTAER